MPPFLPGGVSRITVAYLAFPSPLTLRAIRSCSPYDDLQTTFINLRSMSALVPKAKERHFFLHGWDRLLHLWCTSALNQRPIAPQCDCSTN